MAKITRNPLVRSKAIIPLWLADLDVLTIEDAEHACTYLETLESEHTTQAN